MKATKMSQTVLWENPERAHRIESLGVGATRWKAAEAVTPRILMTGPGSGSVTRATITTTTSAK